MKYQRVILVNCNLYFTKNLLFVLGDNYFLTEFDSLCDTAKTIDNIDECSLQAPKLVEGASFKGVETTDRWPKGCYHISTRIWFNKASLGRPRSRTRGICKGLGM